MLAALSIPSLYLSFSTRSQKVLYHGLVLWNFYTVTSTATEKQLNSELFIAAFLLFLPLHTHNHLQQNFLFFVVSQREVVTQFPGWLNRCQTFALRCWHWCKYFFYVVEWKSAVKPLYLLREPQFALVLLWFESLSFITSFCLLHQRALYPLQGRVSTAIHSGPLLAGCISQGEQFLFLY